MRTHDENYVQRVIGDLADLLPGCYPDLIPLYALLTITRGPATTLEDVHDAWSIWCNAPDPKHRSLKPFSELAPDVQELDRKYMEAIHKAAVVLDGPYAGERCACDQGEPTASTEHLVTVRPAEGDPEFLDWSCSCGEVSGFIHGEFGRAADGAAHHVPPDQTLVITRPKLSAGGGPDA
mgnify:CR=1 FL=1